MTNLLDRGPGTGRPSPEQTQLIGVRVTVVGAVLLALFSIVFFRLWYLQVLSGNSLAAAATKNRVRAVPVPAPRGNILDREGRVLVENQRTQVVELAPNSLPQEERTLALEYGKRLSTWSGKVAAAYGSERFVKWTDEENFPSRVLQQFPKPQIPSLGDPKVIKAYAENDNAAALPRLRQRYEAMGRLLSLSATEVRRRTITSYYLVPYAPIPLKRRAPDDLVAYLAENREAYPGLSSSVRYLRDYPLRRISAQIFGQVGPVQIDPKTGEATVGKYRQLNPASQVGLGGLELKFDGYLRGQDGEVRTTVDAQGNVIGAQTTQRPRLGDQLQLTLDRSLSRAAWNAIRLGSKFNPAGHPGAVVALDPRNGEILAIASNPSFDPNIFVKGVSQKTFESFLSDSGGKPLFNRAVSGGYAAGSTFKPVTAFAAYAAGVANPSTVIQDEGAVTYAGQRFQNAGAAANGPVDLLQAMTVSSDVYFYTLGHDMFSTEGPQALQTWARRLGFGQRTGIEVLGEIPGVVPGRDWRREANARERECRREQGISEKADVFYAGREGCGITDLREYSVGDNVQFSVGQGDVIVTPLQIARLYAAIANGGNVVQPHLTKAILNRSGGVKQTLPARDPTRVDLKATGAYEGVWQGLFQAVNNGDGTSKGVFNNWPMNVYPVFGKTGTAQTAKSLVGKERDTSWYAAFVPDPQRPIVVAAVVEKGGWGAQTAAPIVGEILKSWYDVKDAYIRAGTSKTK